MDVIYHESEFLRLPCEAFDGELDGLQIDLFVHEGQELQITEEFEEGISSPLVAD